MRDEGLYGIMKARAGSLWDKILGAGLNIEVTSLNVMRFPEENIFNLIVSPDPGPGIAGGRYVM